MKQYVVDELRPGDYSILKSYLDEKLGISGVTGLYKLPIDPEVLTGVQLDHPQCRPFYFAIDLEQNRITFELLVRTDAKIGCSCMAYATERQRNWLIQYTDEMLDHLEIRA